MSLRVARIVAERLGVSLSVLLAGEDNPRGPIGLEETLISAHRNGDPI
jgi:hypothetical protein